MNSQQHNELLVLYLINTSWLYSFSSYTLFYLLTVQLTYTRSTDCTDSIPGGARGGRGPPRKSRRQGGGSGVSPGPFLFIPFLVQGGAQVSLA